MDDYLRIIIYTHTMICGKEITPYPDDLIIKYLYISVLQTLTDHPATHQENTGANRSPTLEVIKPAELK